MHYVNVENLTKSFVEKPLFTNITFNIEQGDKIALVAKNGAGKTTLLRILAGKDTADSGKIWVNKDVSVSFLDQNPTFEEDKNVLENILSYDHPVINTVREYELAMEHHDDAHLTELMGKMDELNAWTFESTVKEILTSLNITDLDQLAGSMWAGSANVCRWQWCSLI